MSINKDFNIVKITSEMDQKLNAQLTIHAYKQLIASQVAALFCATILLLGLHGDDNTRLYSWYAFVIAVIIFRLVTYGLFKREKFSEKNITYWKKIFIFGSVLGGLCWGIEGYFIFPTADIYQKTLCILILAGITAGAATSLPAVLSAVVAFLVISIVPFMVQILFFNSYTFYLYDAALSVYLIFLIISSKRLRVMLENIIRLQFRNDFLVKELSAKNYDLAQMATHDSLTSVDNNYLLDINLLNALDRAERDKYMLAILYLDIDNFKGINDHYGHAVGDKLLREFSIRVKKHLRVTDFIARVGHVHT